MLAFWVSFGIFLFLWLICFRRAFAAHGRRDMKRFIMWWAISMGLGLLYGVGIVTTALILRQEPM